MAKTMTVKPKKRLRYTRTFTVNRAKWLHGGVRVINKHDTRGGPPEPGDGIYPGGELYDTATKRQCCLGFVARQCGIARTVMEDIGMASDLGFRNDAQARREWRKIDGILVEAHIATQEMMPFASDLSWASKAASINDKNMDPAKREAALKAVFAKQGFRLVFTGAYGKLQVIV